MARRKKKTFSPLIIKSVAVLLVMVASTAIGIFLFLQISDVMVESNRFTVKTIVIDPSLQFIHKKDLRRLQGKNIFEVDLEDVESKLLMKYPQISELKVEKRYPDQIHLVAKKREKLAQLEYKKNFLILDDEGVILSKEQKRDKNLPSIEGFKMGRSSLRLGAKLNDDQVLTALDIVKSFNENTTLSSYKLENLEVDQLSKILLYLNKDIKAIVDDQKVNYKITKLGVVLTQGNLNLKEIKYIDLRFKDPIIGKK